MDRYGEIKKRLIECVKQDNSIKSVIVVGSSTRDIVKADEYSDLDLFIITENTDKWYSGEYPEKLGKVSISFIEPTFGGGKEKRCIYDEDKDVDMIILTPLQFEEVLKTGVCSLVMNRGYSIIYDANSYKDVLKKYITLEIHHPEITEMEFDNMVNDFYFHNIWADKKLKRGELWSAKMCIDAYMKGHLLKMIELYCYETKQKDVWHDGRFLDKWAGGAITTELKKCFSHYDEEDVKSALLATNSLFEQISREVAIKKGYPYPEKAACCAKKFITEN